MSLNQTSPDPRLSEPLSSFACVTHYDGPGVTRVTLAGELDLAAAPQLDDAIADLGRDCVAVILDLSELTFMDSTGLQAIIRAYARLEEVDCRLLLIPGCRQVQRIFEITGTGPRLEFVNAPDPVRSG